MKIHDIFHVNLLTPYCETSSYGTNYIRPPLVTEENDEEYEVEYIHNARRHKRGCKLQYLIHWKEYLTTDDSWVNHNDLNAPELLKDFYKQAPAGG
jgi:Chromo (CHRromatin Organisation MOdifier) domain